MKRSALIQTGSACIALLFILLTLVSSMAFTKALSSKQFREDMESKLVRYAVLNLEDQMLLESYEIDSVFRPVGSLRNLMTCYIASNELPLTRRIRVGDELNDLAEDVITFGITKGNLVSVKDLIALVMLGGGQDAAAVLEANLADSTEDFVKIINETAAELGMHDTVYTNNPEDEAEKSSIKDMLILATEIIQNSKDLSDILSQAVVNLDRRNNNLPISVSNRILMLNPDESAYDERVMMGFGIGYSSMELNMLISAKCGDQDVLIAMGSDMSSRRTFETASELMNLLDEKPYVKVDCAEEFKQLLSDFEDEGNLLEAEISGEQLFYMHKDIEADFKADKLAVALSDKTQTEIIGERYANADISFEGESIASFPVLLKSLAPEPEPEVKEVTSQAASMETERYTQADETYLPTTYDQYGWIFWSVAGILFSIITGFIASRILRILC